jgi:hypothetical protein
MPPRLIGAGEEERERRIGDRRRLLGRRRRVASVSVDVLSVDHVQGMSDRADETFASLFGRVPARIFQQPGDADGRGDEHPGECPLGGPDRARVVAVLRWNTERNGQARQQLDSQL